MGFGERFKKCLKKKNISQAKYAEDNDINKGYLSRVVNGESPSGDFIMKAVKAFPEELYYLFFGDRVDSVHEEDSSYQTSKQLKTNTLIKNLEEQLDELKRHLAQE